MNDSSRTQGGLICIGVVIVGAWFLLGLLQGSYWALAIPVALLVFFALGLTFWVGYTIATIQVEPFQDDAGGAEDADDSPGAGTGADTGAAGQAQTAPAPPAASAAPSAPAGAAPERRSDGPTPA